VKRTAPKRGAGFKPRTTPMPRSKAPFRASVAPVRRNSGSSGNGTAAARRQRKPELSADPGFPPEVKALISMRDVGCVLRGNAAWGACWGPVDAHHRRLIGSGGSAAPETHTASNGISLCRGHHDAVHRCRARAQAFGLIISRYWHPRRAPVSFDNGRTWWILWHTGWRLQVKPCHDCGHLDRTGNEPCEIYAVHDDLWAAAGMEPNGGKLCIGCLEKRLRRQLAPEDFKNALINRPPFVPPLTARLLDRLGYGGAA
jgi:hypothetical protein